MNNPRPTPYRNAIKLIAAYALFTPATGLFAMQNGAGQCAANSGKLITPVVELYTSEGCSSCPPTDAWVSTLKDTAKNGALVVQAFHVGYWDYIGWVDRFAAPSHTQRQRQIASFNKLSSIYTPQLVLNGEDWRGSRSTPKAAAAAQTDIAIKATTAAGNSFEAQINPQNPAAKWAAYWTVTEHGHASRVTAGENKGEQLQHDFVVRQYVPVGQYSGAQTLRFDALAPKPGHPRQVNLVVYDPSSLRTLQALSLGC